MMGASGSIVIPAHNEASVIGRTLGALADVTATGVEVIVSANGCTDSTALVASDFDGVSVLEIERPSKVAALNAGDSAATAFPRIYLDADIEMSASSVFQVLSHLEQPGALAARPPYTYKTDEADCLVRAYYRARERLPTVRGKLWGAGVYAVSREGHKRISPFPEVIADDLFVDSRFEAHEVSILTCEPVIVRVPRTWRSLLSTLRRVNRGNAQLRSAAAEIGARNSTGRTIKDLVLASTTPAALLDALTYAGFAVVSRVLAGTSRDRWSRDQTSRTD